MPFRQARASLKPAERLTAITWVPFLVAHAHEEVVAGDAGVVDEDVERRRRGLGRRYQRLDGGFVAEIASDDMRALAKLGGERVERLAARAGQDERRALRVQRLGDRAANTAAGAGDERAFSG